MVSNAISNVTTIKFLGADENESTGTVSYAREDAANWLCGAIPGSNSRVIINNGNVVIHSNINISSLHIQPGVSLTVRWYRLFFNH